MRFSGPRLIAISFLLLVSCTNNTNTTFHASHEERKKDAPFSDAVQVGNLFFLAGQVGIDGATRKLVAGGIQAETRQVCDNIVEVLAHHQMTTDNVVKCTVILADIKDFAAFNEVYKEYFPNKPARTTFAASGLAVGAKIEIECIAAR
ncbi:RidA family protein [Spongiivirga sp. MCCC 1A20706]|uniref:RidA family protein n=1 Tax=Spongiivirga sp. MCCC 1A20706 TaxID=3160963 RepID=UPI0039773B93